MELEWMAWTLPTALFFVGIAAILVAMTLWQFASPTPERRGLLPIVTTRGDRLFMGLLGSAYIHLGWIGLTDLSLWWALAISALYMIALMRWG
jgi:predicted small integral membrane protein